MAWRVHSWDPRRREGSVVAPSWGPIAFGDAENTERTTDFEPGEEVVVELLDFNPPTRVARVVALRLRQPAGTEVEAFTSLNARGFIDFRVEEMSPSKVSVWVGECCLYCSPAVRVSFLGSAVQICGPAGQVDFEELELDDPWFRAASPEESESFAPEHRDRRHQVCVTNRTYSGRPADRLFIACDELVIEELSRSV